MYLPRATAAAASFLAFALPSAALDCGNIIADEHKFDLSDLGGPHSVVTSRWESLAETHLNTTYTVDICQPLKKSGKSKKGEECPNGTRVCAIERMLKGDTDAVMKVVAIAGNLENAGGTHFEYEATRLSTSDSKSDSDKEGLRLTLLGGKHPLTGPIKQRKEQRATIEFLCDHDKTGLEGEWKSEDRYDGDDKVRKRDDKKKDDKEEEEDDGTESGIEHQLKKDDSALIWESYGLNEKQDAEILHLTWYTKHACEKKRDDKDGGDKGDDDEDSDGSSHWGFFTWIILIVFLGTAAYLIFGSWLNYNRYGARGWDLVPHGDTIRDVPYLMKDWTRSVLNTVQGTGSRGGYSAV